MNLDRGQPVRVRFGRRILEGYVDGVRFNAQFGVGARRRIVIDTGGAQINASPSQVSPV